jgi:hypothetical protein
MRILFLGLATMGILAIIARPELANAAKGNWVSADRAGRDSLTGTHRKILVAANDGGEKKGVYTVPKDKNPVDPPPKEKPRTAPPAKETELRLPPAAIPRSDFTPPQSSTNTAPSTRPSPRLPEANDRGCMGAPNCSEKFDLGKPRQ